MSKELMAAELMAGISRETCWLESSQLRFLPNPQLASTKSDLSDHGQEPLHALYPSCGARAGLLLG